MSLQKALKIAVIVVSTVIVMFLASLSGYAFIRFQNSIKTEINSDLVEYANQMEDDIDSINSDMYDIFSYDDNYSKLQYSLGINSLEPIYNLNDRLKTLINMKQRTVGYIVFYDNFDKKSYYFNQDIFEEEDVDEIKEVAYAVASQSTSSKSWSYYKINSSIYAICVYRSGNVALCQFYRMTDLMEQLIKDINIDGTISYVYAGDKILGDDNAEDIFKDMSENATSYNGYRIFRKTVVGTDVTIVVAVPINFVTVVNVQMIVLIILTIVTLVSVVVFYNHLRSQLLEPLATLTEDMRKIGEGEMDRKLYSQSQFTEIQTVIDTTDRMIDEIEKHKMVAYEKTIDSQKARMQYLSMQLKPHFYLNGLKTLNVLAMNNETAKIQDVIMHLSEHLRYVLSLEKELVPLQSEIDYVNNYAKLQQEMTDRPIRIEWQVSVERRDWMVPCLCIQTFVENSFKYAKLGNSMLELIIYISINELNTEEGVFLDLYIRDNGDGYADEILDIINNEPTEGGEHVGINNLKRRCKLIYDSGFECVFMNDNGAVSNLFLPSTNRKVIKE